LGRFISEDPAADPNNPNLYTYCGNNPLVRIDPTGEIWDLVEKAWDIGKNAVASAVNTVKGWFSGGGSSSNSGGSSGGSSTSSSSSGSSSGSSSRTSSRTERDSQDNLGQTVNTGAPPDPEPELPEDGPTIPEKLNSSKVIWVDPLDHMKIRNDSKSNTFGPDVRRNDDGTPRPHQGVDLEADIGTNVKAVSDGEIVYINPDKGDYGEYIILKFNKDGVTYYAQYAHLSEISVSRVTRFLQDK